MNRQMAGKYILQYTVKKKTKSRWIFKQSYGQERMAGQPSIFKERHGKRLAGYKRSGIRVRVLMLATYASRPHNTLTVLACDDVLFSSSDW